MAEYCSVMQPFQSHAAFFHHTHTLNLDNTHNTLKETIVLCWNLDVESRGNLHENLLKKEDFDTQTLPLHIFFQSPDSNSSWPTNLLFRRTLVALWLMSIAEDVSQRCLKGRALLCMGSKVNAKKVEHRCTVHCTSPEEKTHRTSWIAHESPAMTGWRGKQKGEISSERGRWGDRGGIKRVLWSPTKTGFIATCVKWVFYS